MLAQIEQRGLLNHYPKISIFCWCNPHTLPVFMRVISTSWIRFRSDMVVDIARESVDVGLSQDMAAQIVSVQFLLISFSAWPGVFLLQFSLNPLGAWKNPFGESNLSGWFWPKQHSGRGQPIAQNQKPNHLLFLQVWQLGQPIWCCMLLFTWKRVNMFIVTAMLCMGNTSTSPCSPCLP